MEQFSKWHSLNANDESMGKKRDVDVSHTKASLFHVYIGRDLIAQFFVNVKGTLTLNETRVKIWNMNVPESIEGILSNHTLDFFLSSLEIFLCNRDRSTSSHSCSLHTHGTVEIGCCNGAASFFFDKLETM